MSATTANLKLPYLYVGQAQKEVTHNEALAILDTLLFPTLEGELSAPPGALGLSDAGRRWLVGENPSGSWVDQTGKIVCWTGDGWRFATPPDAYRVFRSDLGYSMTRVGGAWVEVSAVQSPDGGSVIDEEAREAISAILSILRAAGQIPAA